MPMGSRQNMSLYKGKQCASIYIPVIILNIDIILNIVRVAILLENYTWICMCTCLGAFIYMFRLVEKRERIYFVIDNIASVGV